METNHERKLASIQRIAELHPIEGADAIERAVVLGWNVVVKKGDFKVNDLCVYCEIDSVLPERPEFEFLRSKHFRIKTIKLKGQISQGISFPLSTFSFPLGVFSTELDLPEGTDVTELLGIKKYEPNMPACTAGNVKGSFPSFIPKTDELRIQGIPSVIHDLLGTEFIVTEKLDGTSFTAYGRACPMGVEFGVCSRNNEMKDEMNDAGVAQTCYWRVVDESGMRAKMTYLVNKMGFDIAVQGEIVGPKIQGNPYKLEKYKLFLFNVYNITAGKYECHEFLEYVADELGVEVVPVIYDDFKLYHSVQEIVDMADGKSQLNLMANREGLVFRPVEEMNHHKIGRVSFKAISNQFLLKEKDNV